MPRCPRCTGFLPAGAISCTACGGTFAPLEGTDRPPLRDVPAIEDPEHKRTWAWRATEVGFVVTTLLCMAVGGYGLYFEWFEGSTVGGNWLLPLFLVVGSPLVGMMGGAAFGTVTVLVEPLVRAIGGAAPKEPDATPPDR
ncbi:MAG: hypothetical protein U0736_14505 [Gemmataceae bacterium]